MTETVHVYCDESMPDALVTSRPGIRYLCIGGLWAERERSKRLAKDIRNLQLEHGINGEIKWTKVSPSSIEFYLSLIDCFFSHGDAVTFRCIVVDNQVIDLSLHGDDAELGFYKFYYHMLHHRIDVTKRYRIFCDLKVNRDPGRIKVLERCLSGSGRRSAILGVQALPSHEVAQLQLCDLLLGATSRKFNSGNPRSGAKRLLMERIEFHLGHSIQPTYRSVHKFNVFKIEPGRRS